MGIQERLLTVKGIKKMHEPITRERLDRYLDNCKMLVYYEQKKRNLEKKVGLSGVDYSKIKVTTGNGQKVSEQERYAIILERINKEISTLRAEIKPEHDIIIAQIRRVNSSRSRTIITLKYIEKRSTQDLVEYFFCDDPLWNPNNNLQEFKKTPEYENYRRQYLLWQQKAIEDIEQISGAPFTPANQVFKQLYLEV